MSKKNVLIVENSNDTTGAFNAILAYAMHEQKHNNFIFVLPAKSRLAEKVQSSGFAVESLPFLEISKRVHKLILYLLVLCLNAIRLNRLVRKHHIDLVHVNDFYNLVGVTARALGGHFVLVTHVRFMPNKFLPLLVKLWMKLNLKYSNAVVCVSQAVKKCLPDHKKIHVIYDGITEVPPIKRTVKEKDDNINLLYLAHYIQGKGQSFALEAFAKALKNNPKLRLKFIGGDMGLKKNKRYKKQLAQRAVELSIQDCVEFCGPISDITEVLTNADIMLNFSESESFSLTCLEALSYGIPLIATDCGGPAELFVHKESGYLIPNRDLEAMQAAILLLAGSESLRKRFAQNSPGYVRCKFAAENTVKKLREVYNIALGKMPDNIIHDSQV